MRHVRGRRADVVQSCVIPGGSRGVRHPRHRVGERNGNRRPTLALHPEGTAVRPRPPGARRNRRPLFPVVRGGKRDGTNGVEATTAAMRSGCRRGSNLRRVSAARIRVVPLSFGNGVALPPAASTSVLVAWRSRNAANPMSGTGTQQARTPRCGENRRGGAKPRGRNRIVVALQPRPEGPLPLVTNSCRDFGECAWSGPPRTSRRRGPRRIESEGDRAMRGPLVRVRAEHGLRVVPFHVGRVEREVKAMEADAGSETRRHASVGTPWSRTGNGKRQEGSGEGTRAAADR
jgi:hypothetical protein